MAPCGETPWGSTLDKITSHATMLICVRNAVPVWVAEIPLFCRPVLVFRSFRVVSQIKKIVEMGGGTSLWASPEWKTDPKEIFNRRLLLLGVTIAFAGCSYGFDQGNIGGVLTLPSFRRAFGLEGLSPSEADHRGTLR